MSEVTLTRLSSKGQIVIPKDLRELLGLKTGEFFAMYGENETIVLKKIDIPSDQDFKDLLQWGSDFAKEKKIKKSDLLKAIKEIRSKES
ncbi:MAG: AbrB/MazE/SpoVT family DNA-binding domain-containing protein [Candidatus Thermoplasmatota archaeon]|nr:AbrB/MazE/SpoVT family DNA-binding domain-containing protein [Candidatus Thermoplasmatota archaeon]